MNNNIDIDIIIDEAVKQAFEQMHIESLPIKQSYYNEIQKILFEISNFFQLRQNTIQKKRSNKLTNPYAPEYGFSEEALSYAITVEKKETAIIYHKLNKILSLLRNEQELNYVLYIRKKMENGSYSTIRYEVPESEINDFLTIVQSNKFREDENLRQYANVAIERLENAKAMSEHIQNYFKAIDNTGLKIKLADKYEAYEYHFQKIDKPDKFNHTDFNIEGIRKWLLGRGHDTAGWWVRGDIGLTSVKSVNLNNKFLLLNLASIKSLEEIYSLIKEIFSHNILSQTEISRLVKAFTPAVYDLRHEMNIDINKIVTDLINSLKQ